MASDDTWSFVFKSGIPPILKDALRKWATSLTVEEFKRQYPNIPIELSLEAFQQMGGSQSMYEKLLFYRLVTKVQNKKHL